MSGAADTDLPHISLPVRHGLTGVPTSWGVGRSWPGVSQPYRPLYLLPLGLHHCQVRKFLNREGVALQFSSFCLVEVWFFFFA